MSSWQVVVAIFFVLLPVVLMLDFWGDERLTARGRPMQREWQRQLRPRDVSQEPAPPPDELPPAGPGA